MSISRLCVRISNCSRDFLSTCGERNTVQRLITVGKWNRSGYIRSGAFGRLDDIFRRLVEQAVVVSFQANPNFFSVGHGLLDDLSHGAGAYRVPAFANREAQALLQCDRGDQRDFH